jgi:hypothetical protein
VASMKDKVDRANLSILCARVVRFGVGGAGFS